MAFVKTDVDENVERSDTCKRYSLCHEVQITPPPDGDDSLRLGDSEYSEAKASAPGASAG